MYQSGCVHESRKTYLCMFLTFETWPGLSRLLCFVQTQRLRSTYRSWRGKWWTKNRAILRQTQDQTEHRVLSGNRSLFKWDHSWQINQIKCHSYSFWQRSTWKSTSTLLICQVARNQPQTWEQWCSTCWSQVFKFICSFINQFLSLFFHITVFNYWNAWKLFW